MLFKVIVNNCALDLYGCQGVSDGCGLPYGSVWEPDMGPRQELQVLLITAVASAAPRAVDGSEFLLACFVSLYFPVAVLCLLHSLRV